MRKFLRKLHCTRMEDNPSTLLRRPGRCFVGTHHREILGFSKETENILRQVFQPWKDIPIGERK